MTALRQQKYRHPAGTFLTVTLSVILQQCIFNPLSAAKKDHLLKKKAGLLSELAEYPEEFIKGQFRMTKEDKIKYLTKRSWLQGKAWFQDTDEQPLNESDEKLKRQEIIALGLKRECDFGLFLIAAGSAMMLSLFCYTLFTIAQWSKTYSQFSQLDIQRHRLPTSDLYRKHFSKWSWNDWTCIFNKKTTTPATNLPSGFFTNRSSNVGAPIRSAKQSMQNAAMKIVKISRKVMMTK